MNSPLIDVVLVVFSYFLGSIPSAYITGHISKGIDIRKVGDGKVGATNAHREIGSRAGWMVAVADTCKGATAVLVASSVTSQLSVSLCGLAVIAGHNWPIFLKFKGGQGLAAINWCAIRPHTSTNGYCFRCRYRVTFDKAQLINNRYDNVCPVATINLVVRSFNCSDNIQRGNTMFCGYYVFNNN